MSQNDMVIANADGATVRADINSALQALVSISSGTSAPGTMYAGMLWWDTTNNIIKQRNGANNAWISLFKFNGSAHQFLWQKGADVASASALPIIADGNYFDVTGTTAVTSIATTGTPGTVIMLQFDGALLLTHHATDLVLPGAANILTAAGDHAIFVEYAAGDYRLVTYLAAAGLVKPDKVNAIGSIGGGTQDIDLKLGRSVSGTVDTSTTTFTFSNPKATGFEDIFTVRLTNGGSQTVNWPASVDWAGGSAPSLTAAGVDELVFKTIDGGTIWAGTALLDVK